MASRKRDAACSASPTDLIGHHGLQILERPHPLYPRLSRDWTFCWLANSRSGDAVYLDRIGRAPVSAIDQKPSNPNPNPINM